MRTSRLVRSFLTVGALTFVVASCACEAESDDPFGGQSESMALAALILGAVRPAPGGDGTAQTKCMENGLNAIFDEKGSGGGDLRTKVALYALNKKSDPYLLRDAMLSAGLTDAQAEALYTGCGLSYSAADPVSTTVSPTAAPTDPPVTSGQAFPDALLALIVESTKGMVPDKAQICYRDALLAELPNGADTIANIPQPITSDTLQQVLATLGVNVQRQGELLGNCMMAS